MIVKDYMTKHPVTIGPAMSIVEAQGIMAETKVRHLPVVEQGKRLVGLITQETLRVPPTKLTSLNVWEITRFLSDLTVKDVMVKGKDVITIGPDATMEEAACVMVEHKVGCLPVLEEGVGVAGYSANARCARYSETHRPARHARLRGHPERHNWIPAFAGMTVPSEFLHSSIPARRDGILRMTPAEN